MLTLIEQLNNVTIGINGQRYKLNEGRFECSRCGKHLVMKIRDAKKQQSCCNKNARFKHGLALKHPLWNVWTKMKGRCLCPTDGAYHLYGGRGITICDQWKNDFLVFYNWALNAGWQKGLFIDRINNDLGYNPSNCRFVTRQVSGRNRRNLVVTLALAEIIRQRTKNGENKRLVSEETGVPLHTVRKIFYGKSWMP